MDDSSKPISSDSAVSRREFAVGAAVVGAAAATAAQAAAREVVETEVTIKTPDGTCDAPCITPPARARGPGC